MNLSEALSQPPVHEPKHDRNSKTWGYTEKISPHDSNTRDITVEHYPKKLATEEDWTQAVKDMGAVVVEGYRVRLVEMRHQTHGWTRSGQGLDAVTEPTWWYRFAVEPIVEQYSIEDILKTIKRKAAPKAERSTGPAVFNWLGGDLQLGKVDGDGTQGIVDAYINSIDRAVLEFKKRSKSTSIGSVHLAYLGDCGEGNQSQKGANMWRTELTVTEQYRLFRRLMLYAVDEFRTLSDSIEVDVVNGNHDDMQRFQKTREDDGHATESAIALADALAMNEAAYGHVRVFVPKKDEMSITREVGDSIMTMTHGHHWRRKKAWEWWSGQSLNWHSAGASQFLLHGHEHQFNVDAKRERTIVCTPSFEQESTWWRHKTGDVGKRGAVVFTSSAGEFEDLTIF